MSDIGREDGSGESTSTSRRRFLGSAAALSALGVPDDADADEVMKTVEAAANNPMASLEDGAVPTLGGTAMMEDSSDSGTVDVEIQSSQVWDGREMHQTAEVQLDFPYGVFGVTLEPDEARRVAYELLAAVEVNNVDS